MRNPQRVRSRTLRAIPLITALLLVAPGVVPAANASDHSGYIVVPEGAELTQGEILAHADLYARWGFSRQFIEESPIREISVTAELRWSGCSDNGADGVCRPEDEETTEDSLVADYGGIGVGDKIRVIGDEHRWIALMCGNFSPIAPPPNTTDVMKDDFRVTSAPTDINVNEEHQITVSATVTSIGPADVVSATDIIDVEAQGDCTVSPARVEKPLTLAANVPQTFETTFAVKCSQPSNHRFTFRDELITQSGVYDANLENNHKTDSVSITVWDHADLQVTNTALDCADQTGVDTPFSCTGTTTVGNAGPYGPVTTDASLTLSVSGPGECAITPATGADLADRPIAVGETVGLTRGWTVECTDRSDHEMTLKATASVDANTHPHVADTVPGNNTATTAVVTEVFEEVDLEATIVDLTCSEREANQTASSCEVTVEVANNGPATAVQTETDVIFTPGPTCVANPEGAQTTALTLDAGQTAAVTARVDITCSTEERHAVSVEAVLHNAPTDPHAVDTDTATARWIPQDIKPRSFPSSINVNKVGLIPFALLATADFDPMTDVDVTTLRFGVTGTEDSVQRCASEGEDVNDDDRLDLVCKADTQSTGVTPGTNVMATTGLLTDGTPIFSQDDVKVVGR